VPQLFTKKAPTSNYDLNPDAKKILEEFKTKMQSNESKFTVTIKGGTNRSNTENTLLRRILSTDLKKIFVRRVAGEGVTWIHVKKCNEKLKPYSCLQMVNCLFVVIKSAPMMVSATDIYTE
jgi:hypothetical protein